MFTMICIMRFISRTAWKVDFSLQTLNEITYASPPLLFTCNYLFFISLATLLAIEVPSSVLLLVTQ